MMYPQRVICLIWPLVLFTICLVMIHDKARADPKIHEFGNMKSGLASFPNIKNNWGMENISFLLNESDQVSYMRVFIPKGAIDPASMSRRGLPRGGAGFKSVVAVDGAERAILSYRVRFPVSFNFVRGGKLPGLYGGAGNSGGVIPNGTDGFSFRLMWDKNGMGVVYAYLPSSITYGSGFFRGRFTFVPGTWHQITQELKLNDPDKSNGLLRLWFDGLLVGEQDDLLIRTVGALKINGIFFDLFFGGNDDSWAPPSDTYVDFSSFRMITY